MARETALRDGVHVLIVEDDQPIQRMLSTVLKDENYSVDAVSDGHAALQRLGDEQPDLVILDLMLPDLDGWEVMSRVRADARTAQIPVLIISAVHDLARESLRIGANDFLRKPFGLDALLEKVALLTSGPLAEKATPG